MAYGRKCYCCGETYPAFSPLYYCKACLMKLEQAFAAGRGVLPQPKHSDHCISCGEYEDRKILYTGETGFFPAQLGGGVPICEKCVREELGLYEELELHRFETAE